NQEIIQPSSQRKKDLEGKKQQMKQQLRDEGTVASGKKAKRLEKYIDNKLRKDENRELMAKLAATKVDTSLFSSSKTLGTARETKRQQLRRAMREHKAGINGDAAALYEVRREIGPESGTDDEDGGDDDDDDD